MAYRKRRRRVYGKRRNIRRRRLNGRRTYRQRIGFRM